MKLDTFFEKFDQFADAPGAVAKMRELVLGLAVRGRLFGKEADCEADGLPNGWHQRQLGELAQFINGDRSKNYPSKSFRVDDGVPFINAGHLSRGDIDLTDMDYITSEHFDRLGGGKTEVGDVLYCLRGSLGKCAVVQSIKSGAIASSLLIIRPSQQIASHYLYLFLTSPLGVQLIAKYDNGSAQPNLSAANVKKYVVPLPPLAEQKRIVAKVDELMALCDRLEAQQKERETRHSTLARASLARFADEPTPANLQFLFHKSYDIKPADLRKSILTLSVQGKLVPQDPNDEPASELLSRLARELTPEQRRSQAAALPQVPTESLQYEVPDSWTWARFRDIAIIASNLVKPDQFLDFTHLAPDNIEKGNGVLLPCRTVREDKVISSNHRFYPGQIVYSKIRPNLAKVVVVDFEGLCSADMYPIDALINAFYLQLYMLSEAFLVQAVKTDTRVAMPKINQTELNAIAVPVPPLAEQLRIVAKVEQLMALVDELEAQLADSRRAGEKLLAALVVDLTAGKVPHAAA